MCFGSSVSSSNSIFSRNSADTGGVLKLSGFCNVMKCEFLENTSTSEGGALHLSFSSPYSPDVTYCAFVGNQAGAEGGAIFGGVSVSNSVFLGNSSNRLGGAICSPSYSSSIVSNCTFLNNLLKSGVDTGRAIYSGDSGSVKLFSNIIWEEVDAGAGIVCIAAGGNVFNSQNPTPDDRSKNLVRGGYDSFAVSAGAYVDLGDTSVTVFSADPLFSDETTPAGADGVWGTADDGLRLRTGSAALDQGSEKYLPTDSYDLDHDGDTSEPLPVDMAEFPRLRSAAVDLGAYEAGPGYAQWAVAHGLHGEDLALSASPAEDGISNLVKFGLGLDPWVSSPQPTDGTSRGLPALLRQQDGTFRFVAVVDPSSADLSFALEETENFENWMEQNSGITWTSLGEGLLRLEIQSSAGGTRGFRLAVETK